MCTKISSSKIRQRSFVVHCKLGEREEHLETATERDRERKQRERI